MPTSPQIIAFFALVCLSATGCDSAAKREQAQAQVRRIAAKLDQQTTESGVYVRVKEIGETDPWGTPVQVSYSQGGVAEIVSVRSAGFDGEFQTRDDLVAQGMAANFKGIGEGIKNNAEEAAAKAAKGAVKGTVEGVKEAVKEALPFQKKKPADDSNVKPNDAENAPPPAANPELPDRPAEK